MHASGLEGGVTRNSSPHVIDFLRMVYDSFLAKFPLFFGYWKKYADLEFAIGGTETAEMVYERGVSCISSSVDLWSHYCTFKMDTCHDSDLIRELFERGAHFVGLDFQCHPFWDKYIEFENRVDSLPNVTKIHERIIHIPMYHFSRYFDKFRALIHTRPVDELASEDILTALRDAVRADAAALPPMSDLELDRALRAKLEAYYYDINNRTSVETHKRWTYEQGIKRAYFHVTEVEDEDLANWRKYLDFEEAEGDYERTAFLYERCLVSCALHDELWLRYARWMFAQGKDEDARIIYARASSIYVPIADPQIRLNWARFEEKLGRFEMARDIHSAILEQLPQHVETILSLANLERRHQGNDAAIKLLEQQITEQNTQIAGQLTAEQARILWQCKGSADEARQLYKSRHKKYLESKDFWLSYLKFEIAQRTPDETDSAAHDRIKEVHDLMRAKGRFPATTSQKLSQLYMDYLLERGGDKAAVEYMNLDKELLKAAKRARSRG
ncbi:pre-mRNA-processing factor 39 [Lophiotrema nucula]|uniref:Pre-mRNA-processing factor 39 n=1 Tax=Lophiotrema nucula TaxID=690887 RepID=A0A6A5YPH6_9PLEO|nr:pre-mRNA-processing factor 39 [Lophiotrema nucula]